MQAQSSQIVVHPDLIAFPQPHVHSGLLQQQGQLLRRPLHRLGEGEDRLGSEVGQHARLSQGNITVQKIVAVLVMIAEAGTLDQDGGLLGAFNSDTVYLSLHIEANYLS